MELVFPEYLEKRFGNDAQSSPFFSVSHPLHHSFHIKEWKLCNFVIKKFSLVHDE